MARDMRMTEERESVEALLQTWFTCTFWRRFGLSGLQTVVHTERLSSFGRELDI